MGVALSSIMQRSKPLKLLWPTGKKNDAATTSSRLHVDKPVDVTPDPSLSSNSCRRHPNNDPPANLESLFEPRGGYSTSSSSHSPMDCKTNTAFAASPDQIDMGDMSAAANIAVSNRTQASGVGAKPKSERTQSRRSKTATSNGSNVLHRCVSEPLGRVTHVHRTRSDMPLPGYRPSCEAHSMPRVLSLVNPSSSAKHMEGWSLSMLGRTRGPCTTYEHGVASKPEEVVNRSHSTSTTSSLCTDGSWITTSSSDAEDDIDNRNGEPVSKLSIIPTKLDPHQEKLARHMEYVVTVLKKKMSPLVFTNNRALFLTKILTYQEVQYGYQSNKCIKIGSGEFGEVLYGRMRSTGQLIAIKALKKDKTDMFALLQEAFVLQIASDTDYAPKYLGLTPFSLLGNKFQEWAIVVEFVGNPAGPTPYDFRRTLKHTRSIPHTMQLLLEWVYTSSKIVHGINQFHSMGILINDIKADNILLKPVGNGYHPIFIDFGLASIAEGITLALEVNDSNRAKILKEYSHIAPEVLFGGETNVASDMFSLGKALSLIADTFQVEAFSQVINQCTLWNVSERPSATELTDHLQWLSNSALTHF